MALKKLLARLRACSGPFPWRDAVAILRALAFEQVATGKTGGSRRKFVNATTGGIIFMHQPHDKDMKPWLVRELKNYLEEHGLFEVGDSEPEIALKDIGEEADSNEGSDNGCS